MSSSALQVSPLTTCLLGNMSSISIGTAKRPIHSYKTPMGPTTSSVMLTLRRSITRSIITGDSKWVHQQSMPQIRRHHTTWNQLLMATARTWVPIATRPWPRPARLCKFNSCLRMRHSECKLAEPQLSAGNRCCLNKPQLPSMLWNGQPTVRFGMS